MSDVLEDVAVMLMIPGQMPLTVDRLNATCSKLNLVVGQSTFVMWEGRSSLYEVCAIHRTFKIEDPTSAQSIVKTLGTALAEQDDFLSFIGCDMSPSLRKAFAEGLIKRAWETRVEAEGLLTFSKKIESVAQSMGEPTEEEG